MKTFGLTIHTDRPLIKETTERIIRWAEGNGVECRICSDLAKAIRSEGISVPKRELWKVCDVIITLGGDGSILASAREFGKYGIPIVGINLGKLGFLTEVEQSQIEEALARLKDDKFRIEERLLLEAILPDDRSAGIALNDVVVDHGKEMKLAMLDLFSNGEFVCPYDADGIILATPTGSTAYSLSAGGPIVYPDMDAIAVSPISPHTLALRTIIFPAENVLSVRAGSSEINLRVALDGQIVGILKRGEEAIIKKADFKVRLIKFESKSFYEVLRTKLHWGARPLFNT